MNNSNDLENRELFITPEETLKNKTIKSFYSFIKQFHKLEKKLHDEFKVTVYQIELLDNLFNHEPNKLTPTQISICIRLSKSTITECIDSLECKGYVCRESHDLDRRKIIIRLTEKGKVFCKQKIPLIYEIINFYFNKLYNERR